MEKKLFLNKREYWPYNEWKISTPEEQGLDSKKLLEGLDYIKQNFLAFNSISIFKNGYLIFEEKNPRPYESILSKGIRKLMFVNGKVFKFPNDALIDNYENYWNMRSVTKSIISLLIGTAIDKGFINSIDTKIEGFFKDYSGMSEDYGKKDITIKHLLTMKSGLGTIDKKSSSIKLLKSKNWVKYILDLPLQINPGEKFDYNSANPHLLSAILYKATGLSSEEFAKKYLFDPIGIKNYIWEKDPQGNNFGGGNLFLLPQDLAKIGFLIMNNGIWDGKQVIPLEWIDVSLQKYHLWDYGFYYGYLWYIKDEINKENNKSYITYSTAGAGGQKLLIIPELDLIMVATSKVNFTEDKSYFLNLMIGKYILPAVID